MGEHTRGPWRVEGLFVATMDSAIVVADCTPDHLTRNEERQPSDDAARANASLVAASPDLLAACEVMLTDVARYLEGGGRLTATEAAHVEGMRAAVAKAREVEGG